MTDEEVRAEINRVVSRKATRLTDAEVDHAIDLMRRYRRNLTIEAARSSVASPDGAVRRDVRIVYPHPAPNELIEQGLTLGRIWNRVKRDVHPARQRAAAREQIEGGRWAFGYAEVTVGDDDVTVTVPDDPLFRARLPRPFEVDRENIRLIWRLPLKDAGLYLDHLEALERTYGIKCDLVENGFGDPRKRVDVFIGDSDLLVSFTPREEAVQVMRAFPHARFDRGEKAWRVPYDHAEALAPEINRIEEILGRKDGEVNEKLARFRDLADELLQRGVEADELHRAVTAAVWNRDRERMD